MEVLTLKVDHTNIERVKEFSFLGLMLDANLNWKNTLQQFQILAKKIVILNKPNSLILPHISYCI